MELYSEKQHQIEVFEETITGKSDEAEIVDRCDAKYKRNQYEWWLMFWLLSGIRKN